MKRYLSKYRPAKVLRMS